MSYRAPVFCLEDDLVSFWTWFRKCDNSWIDEARIAQSKDWHVIGTRILVLCLAELASRLNRCCVSQFTCSMHCSVIQTEKPWIELVLYPLGTFMNALKDEDETVIKSPPSSLCRNRTAFIPSIEVLREQKVTNLPKPGCCDGCGMNLGLQVIWGLMGHLNQAWLTRLIGIAEGSIADGNMFSGSVRPQRFSCWTVSES